MIGFGAELVAAMDQRDLLRDVRQVQRFLDGGVAAADDGDVLALVEKTVAGGAARHAAAHEGLLGRQPEVHRAGAGRDDQRVAGVLAAVADQAERPLRQLRGVDVVEHDLGVKALGVREETRHQVGALDAVVVGGPVVDLGGRHQLAALREAGDQHRLEVGAGGVDGSGVARRAGSEDQDAGVFGGGHMFPLVRADYMGTGCALSDGARDAARPCGRLTRSPARRAATATSGGSGACSCRRPAASPGASSASPACGRGSRASRRRSTRR